MKLIKKHVCRNEVANGSAQPICVNKSAENCQKVIIHVVLKNQATTQP